ncbi:hypothetical protein [Actinomycetospora sp. CA-053990]|uniref:hypothetical protein n=1 Tax=Actinomycetospora sp. CA-053990 TaxID=3239891 RepID=UPI003D933AEC
MTQSGRHARDHSSINAARLALASTVIGILAAAVVVLTSAAPDVALVASPVAPAAAVAPVAPGTVVPAEPVTTAPASSPKAAPATTRSRTSDEHETPSTSSRAGARSSGAGCGQRAVSAGEFNPSCSEYQGYLDPGRAGGRAPSSGDLQTEWGCEQGYIPAEECD